MAVRIAVVLIALFVCGSARADFAYTKWGMSPGEVVAASHGDAKLDSNPGKTPAGAVEAVVGTFASGTRHFDSRFDFANGKLSMVLLTQTEGDCSTLRTELLKTYGPPAKDIGILMMLEWDDPIKANQVEFIYVDGVCKVSYAPLIGYSPNKL